MSIGPGSTLEDVRREYESSLSWRVTRPLRAVGRVVRGGRRAGAEPAPPPRYDALLEQVDGERLRRIDAACGNTRADPFRSSSPCARRLDCRAPWRPSTSIRTPTTLGAGAPRSSPSPS